MEPQRPCKHKIHLGLIDSCGGNLTSMTEALWRLDVSLTVSSDPNELKETDGLILPGVGAAQETMDRLIKADLVEFLKEWQKPLLGVCIGMQILFMASEEGPLDRSSSDSPSVPLLGRIPGKVTRITGGTNYPVPHMGFNNVEWNLATSPQLRPPHGWDQEDCYYFVHSYRAPDGPWVVATADYGEKIPAVVEWGRVFGAQFHPEKSQKTGLKFLRSFVNLCTSIQP